VVEASIRAECVPLLLLRLSARKYLCVYRPITGLAMPSKDSCLICVEPFYGKQQFIRGCGCDLLFFCSSLQISESGCSGYVTVKVCNSGIS
jgi:hypothetical protein